MKTLIFLGMPKKFILRATLKLANAIILVKEGKLEAIKEASKYTEQGVTIVDYQTIDEELYKRLIPVIDSANTYVYINEKTLIEAYKIINHFHLPQLANMAADLVKMLSDKSEFRKRFVNNEAKPTRSLIIDHKQDLFQAVKQGTRLIVKPTSGDASTNVMIAGSLQEAELVWAQISLARRRDKTISFLAEEYFEGEQYSVDVYWSNSKGFQYTPFCRQVIGYDLGFHDFRTCYSRTGADIDNSRYADITAKLTDIFESNNIKLAIMHVEFRINTKGELFIIEINPRIGGLRNLIYSISYGFSHIDNVVRSIMGMGDLHINADLIRSSAVLHFWANEVGKFNSIQFHRIEDPKVSIHLERIEAKVGTVVGPPDQGYRKAGYTVLSLDKNEDVDEAFAEVFVKTKVIIE